MLKIDKIIDIDRRLVVARDCEEKGRGSEYK
jgi:hypothetical protein